MAGTSVACPVCSQNITVPVPRDQPIALPRAMPPPVPRRPALDNSPLNTGLQPRSYFGTASVLFGVTALPFGLLMGWIMSAQTGTTFGEMLIITIPGGLLFGLLFGFIMAAFLKGSTITVTVGDRDDLITRINVAMSQIGYNPATESANFLTFRPSFQAGLLAGRFSVVIQGNSATIVGPSAYIKKLAKRLA